MPAPCSTRVEACRPRSSPRPADYRPSAPVRPRDDRRHRTPAPHGRRIAAGNGGAAGFGASPAGAADSGRKLAQVLQLAVPALAVVLADPLQTLVDSACVGRISTLQLAALGPNTAVFNSVFQLFSFLGIATTTTIAGTSLRSAGLSREDAAARREAAESTLCNSLTLALALGAATSTVLRRHGGAFLAAIGTAPEVFPVALQYCVVRALGAPAVMVVTVCQGACLGQQDSWTPAWVVAGMTALSLAGDIYLVWVAGMGLPGAAIATAAAEYLAAGYFLWRVWRDGRRPGGIPLRWKGLPRLADMKAFFTIAAALVARTLVGTAAYFCMTVTATRLGAFPTAAHQIAMQSFWFLSFFPEPLSMAAQSLLPRDLGRSDEAAAWAWLLLKSGAALGLVLAAILALLFTRGTWIFTSDVVIRRMVAELAPLGVLAMAICGPMVILDGISIGAGDLRHLPPSIAAGLAATLVALEVARRQGAGLAGVWWALIAFYAARLAGHLVHFWRTRKTSVFAGGS